MPTIIYPPSITWNWMFQRPQQLMRQFASMGYTVLYENLGDFPQPGVKQLSPTFYLCQGVSALSVKHPRPRILWISVPSHINLINQYSPDLVVYDAVDEPKDEFSSWAPYYPTILSKAQLIFASAQSIYDNLSASHPNVHLVPNGVDYSFFSQRNLPRPNDLPKSQPIIGYSGAIAPWVDWELIHYLTDNNKDFNFIFIGTLFQMHKFPINKRNVMYLGLKPYAKLPAYLQNFNLGLIPFRITEMTKGCNPIKLYEYYASGIPVMATPLPELISIPKIYLDSEPLRFSLRMREIIKEGDSWRSERQAFASTNDWHQRAISMDKKIEESIINQRI